MKRKATIFVLAILLSLNAPAILCDSNQFTEEGKSEETTMRVECHQQMIVHTEDLKVSERPLVRSGDISLSRENNPEKLRILTKDAYFTSYIEKYSHGGISAAVENGHVNDNASSDMNVAQSDDEGKEKVKFELVKVILEDGKEVFVEVAEMVLETAEEIVEIIKEGVVIVVGELVDLGKEVIGFLGKLVPW